MSRIRTIKPEFWVSEQVVSCSPEARLLFIGVWNFCDDNGVHPVGYVKLKAEIFPCDNYTIDQIIKWVNELLSNNLLREYVVEERGYWIVPCWHKHQKIDRPHPKYPLPESGLIKIASTRTQRAIDDNSTNDLRTVADISPRDSRAFAEPSPLEGNGMERKGKDKEICEVETLLCPVSALPTAGNLSLIRQVFEYWQKVMKHPGARLDKKRSRLIETALVEGYTVEALKQAIDGCSLTPFNMGENDRRQCYDGIDLIFRDADHIDRFIKNAQNPPTSNDDRKCSSPDWV